MIPKKGNFCNALSMKFIESFIISLCFMFDVHNGIFVYKDTKIFIKNECIMARHRPLTDNIIFKGLLRVIVEKWMIRPFLLKNRV